MRATTGGTISCNMCPTLALHDLPDACIGDAKHAGYRPKRKSLIGAQGANLADLIRVQFRVYVKHAPARSRLDHLRGPAAILGAIRPVIVDAINAKLGGWSRTHVCEEGHKVVLPAIANKDAAPAVARPGFVARVGASALHFDPCIVFDALLVQPRMSVAGLRATNLVDHIAAAGPCLPVSQLRSRNYGGCSAVAVAGPPRFRPLLGLKYTLNHDKATKTPSRHLDHRCSQIASQVRVASNSLPSVRTLRNGVRCAA